MKDEIDEVALAVDIGGTKVDAALVTASGDVLEHSRARRPTGREASRGEISQSIQDAAATALRHLGAADNLVGIGVGSAGPVDLPNAAVSPINLPSAAGLVIPDVLGGLAPGVPVRLALDGTCIALAEHWLGALRGRRSGLAMVVSTGIGSGFIVNDEPVTGASGNAGHIGQIRVRTRDPEDPIASTLEAIASGPSTVAWARSQGWRGTTGEELAESYREHDGIAQRAVRRSADAVGQAIAMATTLFDLEAVTIAGGFANVADDYIDLVRVSAHESAVLPFARGVTVERSTLAADGPLLGAAALVLRS